MCPSYLEKQVYAEQIVYYYFDYLSYFNYFTVIRTGWCNLSIIPDKMIGIKKASSKNYSNSG